MVTKQLVVHILIISTFIVLKSAIPVFKIELFFTENTALPPTATHLPDATFLQQGKLYSWLDRWTLARGRDCLYLWSSAVAVELSHGSNGWFRYILDGKLSTMYSSGTPEGGNDSNGKLNSSKPLFILR